MKLLYPEFLMLFAALLYLYTRNRKPIQLYLALALMIVALSRPVMTRTLHEEKAEGVEAVVALDLSYSMQAADIKPSRLVAAKETVRKLFSENRKNRYALYGFTTNALILSPATQDYALLKAALDSIEEGDILTHGTSLSHLLQKLAQKSVPVENVVILTDGGEEQDADRLIEIAKDSGMRLIVVGMASDKGTLLRDRYGKVLKDTDNALVISRLNPILKKVALQSGGAFLRFEDPDTTAQKIAARLDAVADKSLFSHKERQYRDLFWIPLLAAAGLFLFYFVQIPKKWLLLIPFVTQTSDAAMLDWFYLHEAKSAYHQGDYKAAAEALNHVSSRTLQLAYDKALTAYKMRRFKKALSILDGLETSDARMKFKILSLTGNAHARLRAYSKARRAWQAALIIRRDENLLYNLKAILG
ncbi:MAG: hypothetical protein DSZ05_04185, partial [Sulfurospirillum sp.]